jgi:hypothetical protein
MKKGLGKLVRKVGGLVLLAPYARACCAVRVAPVNGCELPQNGKGQRVRLALCSFALAGAGLRLL